MSERPAPSADATDPPISNVSWLGGRIQYGDGSIVVRWRHLPEKKDGVPSPQKTWGERWLDRGDRLSDGVDILLRFVEAGFIISLMCAVSWSVVCWIKEKRPGLDDIISAADRHWQLTLVCAVIMLAPTLRNAVNRIRKLGEAEFSGKEDKAKLNTADNGKDIKKKQPEVGQGEANGSGGGI